MIKSDEQVKREFDMQLCKARLKDYLKADPQQAGERTKLSRVMTLSFFFKYFYCEDSNADKLIDEFKYNINEEHQRNIILHGYEGCGKTTFMNYWMNKDSVRHLVIQFDKYIQNVDAIKGTIIGFIYEKIREDISNGNGIICKEILNLFATDYNINVMSKHDVRNNFIFIFDKIKHLIKSVEEEKISDAESWLNTAIKLFFLQKYSINELMLFIVMWDVCDKRIHNLSKECYIVFENLDTLFESFELQELITEIGYFRNNVETLFLELKDGIETICLPTEEYVCILVMRDTTKAAFSEHMNGQKVSLYVPKHSLTFNYSLDKVIDKKAKYLERLKVEHPEIYNDNCEILYKGVKCIQKILKDYYVSDTIFTLFNNNFRKEFEVLVDIEVTEDKIFKAYDYLCSKNTDWARYGSRCILFRKIFDLLNREGFLETLKSSEHEIIVNCERYAINLSRLILLFLQNSYIHTSEGQKSEEPDFISMEKMIKEILKICDDEDEIANALWEMFEFRKRNNWNHLITFDQMHEISKGEILRQITAVKSGSYADVNFGKIRITLAGETYIEKVLPHFEYFAARNIRITPPSLFAWTINDLLKLSKLETYIENVKKEVTDCCNRLLRYNHEIITQVPEFKGSNFLSSKFSHWKIDEDGNMSAMYHGERLIHSQIGYLDSGRMFVLDLLNSRISTIYKNMNGFNLKRIMKLVLSSDRPISCVPDEKIEIMKNHIDDNTYLLILKEKILVQYICNDKTRVKVEITLEQLSDILKNAINRLFIAKEVSYIELFGLKDANKKVTEISPGTFLIVECYEACIQYIKDRNYENYTLEINQMNGRNILAK